MGASHKIKGIKPEENTKADLFPLIYLNFVLENIQKAENDLSVLEYDDGCQYLLINLDMLITICKKYPTTASMNIHELNRRHLQEIFWTWWIRNEKKIPAKYRDGIKESAEKLFSELLEIKSWITSE